MKSIIIPEKNQIELEDIKISTPIKFKVTRKTKQKEI